MNVRHTSLAALAAIGFMTTPSFAEDHIVHIVSDYDNLRFVFEPATLNVATGDTVTWVNEANEEHNVITYPGGYPKGGTPFQSPYLTTAGERFTVTFATPGTYQYHCLPHLLMGMKGEIVVERRSLPEEFHTPSRAEVLAYRSLLLEWFDEDDNLMEIRMANKPRRQGDHETGD